MKTNLKFILILFIGTFIFNNLKADYRYAVASGNWNATSTWSSTSAGSSGASIPADGDNVYVEGGFTVTVDANTATLTLLSIASASTLTISSDFTVSATTITVNGTYNNGSTGLITKTNMTFGSSSIYDHKINGGTVPTATWATSSTCLITGMTSTYPFGMDQSFGNLTFNSSSNSNLNMNHNLSCSGNLTLSNTGGGFLRFASGITSYSANILGNLIHSGNDFRQNNGNENGTGNFTVDGNFSKITSGTYIITSGSGNSTLTVKGNVTVSGGRLTLSEDPIGNGRLYVQGNFNHTAGGTITETDLGGATIIFNGSSAQTITGGGTILESPNFEFANSHSSGVSLLTDYNIPSNLNVTSGILDLGSFTMNRETLGGTITIATGAKLKIGGTNTFPSNYTTKSFGSPGIVEYSGTNQTIANLDYADLTLSGSGTKTFPALSVNSGNVSSNPILGIGTLRILNNTLKVILPDNSSNDEGYFTGIYRNYRRYKVNDLIFATASSSQAIGYYGGSVSPDLLTDGSSVIKSFSSYLTSASPTNGYFYVALGLLPVTLTSFTAKPAPNRTVSLNWATSSETVNKGFRIERQAGNITGKYESLGFVSSKANGGNSQTALYYNFIDASPRSGATAYYRLAQEDLDGKTTFSEVMVVKFSGETVSMVYPNPSNGAVNISRTATGKKMNVQVIDMAGRMLQQFTNITDSNFKLNISKSGMYNIKMTYPETGEQSVQRIVIER